MIDNTLTWKSHIDIIIWKLSVACFTVRAIKIFCDAGYLEDGLPFWLTFYY